MRNLVLAILAMALIGLTSCNSSDTDEQPNQCHEVFVSLSGIQFSLTPSRATATEAGITHIALKVFDSQNAQVAEVSQIVAAAGTDFNNLKLQLPAGTYTFVAVAHSATADDTPCATITSPTEATLPEAIVPTVYSHAEQVTIANENNQTVTLNMGKRINATFHLTSTDIVPDEVAKVAVRVNPGGQRVSAASPAKFNPSTGLAIGDPFYSRVLPVTAGSAIDVSFNILLPADTQQYPLQFFAMDASENLITDYERQVASVPFQRAYITNATGTYFRYVTTTSLTFDLTQGTIDINY